MRLDNYCNPFGIQKTTVNVNTICSFNRLTTFIFSEIILNAFDNKLIKHVPQLKPVIAGKYCCLYFSLYSSKFDPVPSDELTDSADGKFI